MANKKKARAKQTRAKALSAARKKVGGQMSDKERRALVKAVRRISGAQMTEAEKKRTKKKKRK